MLLWRLYPSILAALDTPPLTDEELQRVMEEVERYVHFDRVYLLLSACAVTANVGPGTFGLVFRKRTADEDSRRMFDFLPLREDGAC